MLNALSLVLFTYLFDICFPFTILCSIRALYLILLHLCPRRAQCLEHHNTQKRELEIVRIKKCQRRSGEDCPNASLLNRKGSVCTECECRLQEKGNVTAEGRRMVWTKSKPRQGSGKAEAGDCRCSVKWQTWTGLWQALGCRASGSTVGCFFQGREVAHFSDQGCHVKAGFSEDVFVGGSVSAQTVKNGRLDCGMVCQDEGQR